MDLRDIVICCVLIALGTGILVQPMLRYICVGWQAKRKEIMDGLSPSARHEYFTMFSGSQPPPDKPDASKEFEKLYERWYGRRYFCIPAILLGAVALIASSSLVLSYFGKGFPSANALFHLPIVATAALTGAYLWVVNDHIGRARRLDFSPADVMWAVLRIVISIPMAYALSAFAKDEAAAISTEEWRVERRPTRRR